MHGDDSIHGPVSGYITAGLRRGDRLCLGHIRQVHGAKRAEIEMGEYDCVKLIGERDARVVDRCARLKSNAGREPTSHRIGLGDCA